MQYVVDAKPIWFSGLVANLYQQFDHVIIGCGE